MTRFVIGLLLIGLFSINVTAQRSRTAVKSEVPTSQTVTTKNGRVIILSSAGTWKYAQNPMKPSSPWDGDTIQTVERAGFTFDLKQARFANGKVTVYLLVTPREDKLNLCVLVGIFMDRDSTLWDNLGNSYKAADVSLAEKGACADTVLEQPVRARVTFNGIAHDAVSAASVSIVIRYSSGTGSSYSSGTGAVEFRRVPLTSLQAANAQRKRNANKAIDQDQTVTIKDGRIVILKTDGTWKYAENLVKPKSPWDVDPIQTIQRGPLTFDLKQARLAGGNVTFYLVITSHAEGITLDIMTNDNFAKSLLWDDLGNRHVARRSTIANKGGERMEFIPEVPVKASIIYEGISEHANSAASVKLVFWATAKSGTETATLELEFRRVPFAR